ncbi:hypothetical protein [Planctomyces sp. SH-PL14]|uniref:hypothetical protein n=1 Tax=Planctomyces sp. SH-PL14 TaxID=1632864 RepID=UPI00078D93C8|nr:hypothetical protein [Planctomyces sp. SH-PL14]AMV21825.1 hypothetical protein VT03_28240 [Planctomyces sp. SH-PL14]
MSVRIMTGAAVLFAASLLNSALAQVPAIDAPYPAAGAPPAPYCQGVNVGQYPQLNAPLYPSPVQYTPPWNGGAIYTNQALAPHEYLYPHQYKAMYPPFYHKVHGGWIVTPWGVRQHEKWKLEGTMVKVNYLSHRAPFSFFIPPRH